MSLEIGLNRLSAVYRNLTTVDELDSIVMENRGSLNRLSAVYRNLTSVDDLDKIVMERRGSQSPFGCL